LSGITKTHGQSYDFYLLAEAPYTSTCQFITRTCNDGTFSGDVNYANTSCIVLPNPEEGTGTYYFRGGTFDAWKSFNLGDALTNVYLDLTTKSLNLGGSGSTGQFISQVFDAGSVVSWADIDWVYTLTSNNEYEFGFLPKDDLNGVIAMYHFNNDGAFGESASFLYDHTGNGNDGSSYASPVPVADNRFGGGSTMFNSADKDGYGFTPFITTQEKTVSIWIKPVANVASTQVFLDDSYDGGGSNFKGIQMSVYALGITTRVGDSSFVKNTFTVPSVCVLGQWCHIILVQSLTDLKLYVDGNLVGSQGITSYAINPNSKMYLGGYGGNWGPNSAAYDGQLDDLVIWNRALSLDEVNNVFSNRAETIGVSVRSCSDSACSTGTYSKIVKGNPAVLNVVNNQFFQYKVDYYSTQSQLNNVTINFN